MSYHLGRNRLPYYPRTVSIEPTSFCNIRCLMCPHSFDSRWTNGHMDMELYKKIIQEIKEYAFRVILQIRGEPLLHKDIVEMVRISKSDGLDTGFNTNAVLLTKDLSARLIAAGLDAIAFSFNGETKEVHNWISQSECFDVMLQNVLNFLEIKKGTGSNRPSVRIQVMKFQDWEGESGALKIGERFKRIFSGLPVDSIHGVFAINRAGDAREKANISITPTRYEYLPCRWLWSDSAIGWNGNVYPCCNDFNEDYVLGNVAEIPLRDIWNGEKMLALRKTLVGGRHSEIPLCRDCDILYSVAEERSFARRAVADVLRLIRKWKCRYFLCAGNP
ncbi:MAG: radical SAM/SPASM domain-containing protein [Thermodesulfobacteriota bacterium]